MSRGTAPRLTLVALVSGIVASFAVPWAPGAQAEAKHTVTVSDTGFNPTPIRIEAGDTIIWDRAPGTQAPHTVSSNHDGGFHHEFTQGAPASFERTFNNPGNFAYVCLYHGDQGMIGQIEVAEAPAPSTTTTTEPPTTTTTAPPPTTTTTAPAPPPPPPPATTTTTRPRSTTTTTRPPAPTATTQPPAQASNDDPKTTDTTARATTTTGKATTPTTAKKKPTTTTKPPETTTTSAMPALPAEWIPRLDIIAGNASTTTTTEPEVQVAAGRTEGPKKGGGGGFPVVPAAALGLLLLGGGGWAWYHRNSRYLPA